MKKYTIQQVAKLLNFSQDTLRFYEKEGLIQPLRGENKYRYYDEALLMKLKYLKIMKYAHFSLQDIKFFMNLLEQPFSTQCNQAGIKKFNEVKDKIQKKAQLYQEIAHLLETVPMTPIASNDEIPKMNKTFDHFVETLFKKIEGEEDES